MDLILTRRLFDHNGIIGNLLNQDGSFSLSTLEHAYADANGGFSPKMPDGVYTCVRGIHRLEGMISDFVTFEITGVIGHTDILFHVGNFNSDSAGCVLLGVSHDESMLYQSKVAFERFMLLQHGVNQFRLLVNRLP